MARLLAGDLGLAKDIGRMSPQILHNQYLWSTRRVPAPPRSWAHTDGQEKLISSGSESQVQETHKLEQKVLLHGDNAVSQGEFCEQVGAFLTVTITIGDGSWWEGPAVPEVLQHNFQISWLTPKWVKTCL